MADNEDSEDIEIVDGYYSIEDTISDLMSNEECLKTMKGWLMQTGNLSMVSTLEGIRDMMGFDSFYSLKVYLDTVSLRNWAQVNRMLSKIKK